MGESENVIAWLLNGDISVQYQVKRDLLKSSCKELESLQSRIPLEGWGKKYLDKRDNKTGLWGGGVYSPKWISTHYTLLDLKNLCIPPANKQYVESSRLLIESLWFNNGLVAKNRMQDMCICGMLLSICCYAGIKTEKLNEIIDYIILHVMPDGGWNCRWQTDRDKSSVHTTLSVLEGIRDYINNGNTYRAGELKAACGSAHQLLLKRHLYKTLSTGRTIKSSFIAMPYPSRWYYDIFRCLDYFRSVNQPYDERMNDALNILIKKRGKNGRWKVNRGYSGRVHFNMEKPGSDSRWNTLRAIRILNMYGNKLFSTE